MNTISKRFIQLTSGWIPVSVLLLFAAALVSGQDRAEPPAPHSVPSISIDTPGLLDVDDRMRIESIRLFVDAILPMPETVEISISPAITAGQEKSNPETGAVE